jgi:hypothetical protein
VGDFRLPPRSRRRNALFWVIMQRVAVISYRLLGTTYLFLLQGSRIPETPVINYRYSLRNIPKERRSYNMTLFPSLVVVNVYSNLFDVSKMENVPNIMSLFVPHDS